MQAVSYFSTVISMYNLPPELSTKVKHHLTLDLYTCLSHPNEFMIIQIGLSLLILHEILVGRV